MITIKEATTKQEIKQFIMFPFELYKNCKEWVPPLIFDDKNTFSKDKNPAFKFSEAIYFLAYKEGKIVGRIAAIINHRANKTWNENRTRFGWIAFIDDYEVSKALLDAAEKWGDKKGMKGIHGPLGFCDLDTEGMLVEGFQNEPSITGAYNYEYFSKHMEKHGLLKKVDWLQYKFNASQEIPDKINRINKLIEKKYNVKTVIPQSKKELKKYIPGFFTVLNASFKNLYGYSELSQEQIDYYTKAYFGFVRPEFICFIVDKNDQVIAFGITLPSLSKGFKKANGRIFPFGFYHILKAMKQNETVDLYFNGVHPDWQNKGIHSLYYVALNNQYKKYNVKYAISTGQLETNTNAVGIWDNYDKEPYFRTRCYTKG